MIEKKKFSKEELNSISGGKVEECSFFGEEGFVYLDWFAVYNEEGNLLAAFENESDANRFDIAYKNGEISQDILEMNDVIDAGKAFLNR